jgi:hypothetical protein
MKKVLLVVLLTCMIVGSMTLTAQASATKCDFSG